MSLQIADEGRALVHTFESGKGLSLLVCAVGADFKGVVGCVEL